MKGHQQLQAGKESLKSNVGKAVAATAAVAAPTMISANYQAIIRDIAIKADIANKPGEQQLTRTVIDTPADTGMTRNGVADWSTSWSAPEWSWTRRWPMPRWQQSLPSVKARRVLIRRP